MKHDKEYIERGALLAKLKQHDELGWWATVNMSDVGMMIEDLPAADVAPVRHGEWIEKEATFPISGMMVTGRFPICSVCNTLLAGIPNFKLGYCPNCGAKMDGGKK